MASEVIRQLDIAQDHRRLSAEEFQLRKELKCRGLGLASLERSRRLVWLKEGDECTRFFHLSRKNFIHQLKSDDGTYAWTHDQKEKILFDHFNQSLGTKEQRQASLDWDMLGLPRLSADHLLDASFSESEIRNAVMEKASGPDGFTDLFYRNCWDIIKFDVVAAFQCIYNLTTGPLAKLNGAVLRLLPKKDAAERPGDYRPISLIHSFAKLISMVLALRLAPHIDSLVSHAQSEFIKRRSIQDNFLYVRNLARAYHRKKTPTLLLKIDISKAFDSVSWEYLLELLEHRGFPSRWRNWLALMLSTSSSSVRLNGTQGKWIKHLGGSTRETPSRHTCLSWQLTRSNTSFSRGLPHPSQGPSGANASVSLC
jgi:hypothetical protein